ncbi:hypothetical protein QT711_03170 [Sporosarcina saromensis]|uniref:Uncharacterized protein n=1 Tax=Sporosarcina saromensis TaxID=359365 RepID=A0ABU4G5E1_9BACL|nr:hypothetical protein [Sporosarcina saromensis]MDW0112171.1 hypothetical protein [Sporosarcina saromensis]
MTNKELAYRNYKSWRDLIKHRTKGKKVGMIRRLFILLMSGGWKYLIKSAYYATKFVRVKMILSKRDANEDALYDELRDEFKERYLKENAVNNC